MMIPEVVEKLQECQADHVVIAGIEAHVCVQQTALDLLRNGYYVHIAADAVSAQDASDVELMKGRLTAAGANISSSLSILYEIMGTAKHPAFKEVFGHVKNHMDQSKL